MDTFFTGHGGRSGAGAVCGNGTADAEAFVSEVLASCERTAAVSATRGAVGFIERL